MSGQATFDTTPENERGPDGFYRAYRSWPDERQFERERAVDWIAPNELIRGAVREVLWRTLGELNDRRDLLGLAPPLVPDKAVRDIDEHGLFHRTSDFKDREVDGLPFQGDTDSYWFDYVADVGDGFDATLAVAQQLAADELKPSDSTRASGYYDNHANAGAGVLPRGRLLIMGGDEVYPIPINDTDHSSYRSRTAGPYELALQYRWGTKGEAHPVLHLYAIPGNHDWYDGLGAFNKQFCTGQWIGAWKTQQHRSYFAVELPFNWWIWGIDTEFEGPMDLPQLEYFKQAGRALGKDDGVILCCAKPTWLACKVHKKKAKHGHKKASDPYTLLRWFLEHTIEREKLGVRLMLSGDEHFYVSHQEAAPEKGPERLTKIVSGGGGASLSLTHSEKDVDVREPRQKTPTRYNLKRRWPDGCTSQWKLPFSTAKRIAGVTLLTKARPAWSFAALVAGLYGLFAYVMRLSLNTDSVRGVLLDLPAKEHVRPGRTVGIGETIRYLGGTGWHDWGQGFGRLWTQAWDFGPFLFLAPLVAVGLVFLAKKKNERGLWFILWGIAHFVAHLMMMFVITTTAMVAAAAWIPHDLHFIGFDMQGAGVTAVVLGLAFLIGPAIFVFYLFAASAFDERNLRELAAALSEPNWKHFLRVHVSQEKLTVYALGLRSVPLKRKFEWFHGLPAIPDEPVSWELIDRIEVAKPAAPKARPAKRATGAGSRARGRVAATGRRR